MDPNEALRRIRELVAGMLHPDSQHVDSGDAIDLAQAVTDLDEWMSKASLLPDAWKKGRRHE